MNEFHDNLWAPWRLEYIQALGDDGSGCFLCDDRDQPERDRENHVVLRSAESIVVMNRFPYTNGHLLIAPRRHVGQLEELTDAEMRDLWWQTRDAKRMLDAVVHPHGHNIGVNLGRCAGAGLPGHLHLHVVPRWNGDTNYMAVLGDVRVIPQSLDQLYGRLVETAAAMSLPTASP